MFISDADALRKRVVACFQQWPLLERPPIEEIHAIYLAAENSRHFQRGVAVRQVPQGSAACIPEDPYWLWLSCVSGWKSYEGTNETSRL